MKVFACCLLVPLVAAAQQGPRGAAPRPRTGQPPQAQQAPARVEDLCLLEGQVMNAATGEPLGKAALTLRRVDAPPGPPGYGGPSYTYSATSQASGKFSIAGVEPGKYRLSATRTGFVALDYGARDYLQPGSTLTLDARQSMSGLMLRMTPNGVITGHVVDEDREPVSFLQVHAMRYRYTQGKKQLVRYASATTNDLGEYRIFGLPPGRYFISVSARRSYGPERRPPAQTGQEEEYVATYYPGTTEVGSASPLEIGPGALFTGADVALGKRRTVHVQGHVTDNTGLERRRPMVMLVPRGVSGVSSTRSTGVDANGNFDIRGITAGSYTLLATIPDRGRSFSAKMPVEVGAGNVENLSLTLNPGVTVSGVVRLDEKATADVTQTQVSLRPRDPVSIAGPGSSNPFSKVKEDGSFSLSNVSPDVYDVTLTGIPDGFYLKSALVSGQDVLTAGLDLSQGPPATIDILLAPNAGQAGGLVQNEQQQPAAGATVVLVPQERERKNLTQYYKTATTDSSGAFTFKNLDPGQYRVYAWKEVESGAYMDPDFLAPVENRGEPLTIKEGSQENLQLKLIG
jgi:hypothetical protein